MFEPDRRAFRISTHLLVAHRHQKLGTLDARHGRPGRDLKRVGIRPERLFPLAEFFQGLKHPQTQPQFIGS